MPENELRYIRYRGGEQHAPMDLAGRCPKCKREVIFENTNVKDIKVGDYFLGQRICPNRECRTCLFTVCDNVGTLMLSYPPQRIDFDPTNVPDNVLGAFEEAVECHASKSYIASAMLIRKTVEEICRDKSAGNEKGSLKTRIKALGDIIIIPPDLLKGLDKLRMLGNDAAHIRARIYNQIGERETTVGLNFAKEILKAVYQYDQLLKDMEDLEIEGGSEQEE